MLKRLTCIFFYYNINQPLIWVLVVLHISGFKPYSSRKRYSFNLHAVLRLTCLQVMKVKAVFGAMKALIITYFTLQSTQGYLFVWRIGFRTIASQLAGNSRRAMKEGSYLLLLFLFRPSALHRPCYYYFNYCCCC